MEALIRVVYDRLPTVEVLEHAADARGNIFTVRRPFSACGVVIPAGFSSDGASVPRLLWGVVFPSGDRAAMFAAVFHDYVYRTHPSSWTRSEADDAFLYFLIQGEVPLFRSVLAYIGVRLFGKRSWTSAQPA